MNFSKYKNYFFLFLVFHSFAPHILSGAMTKHIEQVRPRIGQQGTEVEVAIRGIALEDPRQIIFNDKGIKAIRLRASSNEFKKRHMMHGGRVQEEVLCTFVIEPNCKIGKHSFRLLTATALTHLGTFHITPFQIIHENETSDKPNDTVENAIEVPIHSTLYSSMGSHNRGDVDLYKVSLKANQLLSVLVESANLSDQHYGDSEFDLALRILDEKGHVLAQNDDNSFYVQDPTTSIKRTKSGYVYVEVKRSFYCPKQTLYSVHFDSKPFFQIAYPSGGLSGSEQSIQLKGNTEKSNHQIITFPKDHGFFTTNTGGHSSIQLRSKPYPNVFEKNSELTHVEKLPIALNGIISHQDTGDKYRLNVKKGETWHIRVFASTFGSPIDPEITLTPITENGLAERIEAKKDDSKLTERDVLGTSLRSGGGTRNILDPSLVWTPQRDGEYELLIRDKNHSGSELGVYRIEIEPLRTKFHSVLRSRTFDWTESTRVSGLAVPQGSKRTINLSMPKGQWKNIDGDFDIIAKGLPEGIKMISPRVPANTKTWPIQLIASNEAKLEGSLVTFHAKQVKGDQLIESYTQQNVPFINHSGGDAWSILSVDQHIVGVTDPAPFSIEVTPPKSPLLRNGNLSIKVKIKRHGNFKGAVTFVVGFIHPSIQYQPITTIEPGQTEATLSLTATANAPLEKLPFIVNASTVHETIDPFLGTDHIRISSDFHYIQVSQPFVSLSCEAGSIRRDQTGQLKWKVKQLLSFEGKAKLKLLGLPKGVSVINAPTIDSNTKNVSFDIQVTPEALLGPINNIRCEADFQVNGQSLLLKVGQGRLRIDPKAQKIIKASIKGSL